MSWRKELEELERRRALAQQMGGAEGIARQRRRGKLTVRERIDALADPGSFREFMGLRGHGRLRRRSGWLSFTPKPLVEGMCRIGGRKVIVTAGDFTVRGGSARQRGGLGRSSRRTSARASGASPTCVCWTRPAAACARSRRWAAPICPTATSGPRSTSTAERVPVVSAVMGSVAGLPAVNACIAHFNLMVATRASCFPAARRS